MSKKQIIPLPTASRDPDRIVGAVNAKFMGILYILQFDGGRYYVGSTTNLERRIYQHKSGHTPSTKRVSQSFELVFSQEFASIQQARAIESKIKSWKRRDFIEKIIEDGYIKIV